MENNIHTPHKNSHHMTRSEFMAALKGLGFDFAFKVAALVVTFITFVLVAFVALKLGHFVHWVEVSEASPVLVWMLKLAEWALAGLDLVGLVYSTKKHLDL